MRLSILVACVFFNCCGCNQPLQGVASKADAETTKEVRSEPLKSQTDLWRRRHVAVSGPATPVQINCWVGDRPIGVFFVRGKVSSEVEQIFRLCHFEINYWPETDKVLKIRVAGGGEAILELNEDESNYHILLELKTRDDSVIEPRLKSLKFPSDVPIGE